MSFRTHTCTTLKGLKSEFKAVFLRKRLQRSLDSNKSLRMPSGSESANWKSYIWIKSLFGFGFQTYSHRISSSSSSSSSSDIDMNSHHHHFLFMFLHQNHRIKHHFWICFWSPTLIIWFHIIRPKGSRRCRRRQMPLDFTPRLFQETCINPEDPWTGCHGLEDLSIWKHNPICSMGWLYIYPTWLVDFYGKCR